MCHVLLKGQTLMDIRGLLLELRCQVNMLVLLRDGTEKSGGFGR